jgi:hypothetical protein
MARCPGGHASRARLAIPIAAIAALALVMALPAFASAAQTLTVQKAGAGTGTVTSFPSGINCGSTCSAPFNEGATVTLTGSPSPGSQSAQWSGCDSVSAEDKCQVSMSGARSVTATFNLASHQLTVTKVGAGTGTVTSSPSGIECGSTCQASFLHGTAVTLTGAPGPNTEAVKWSGCGSVNGENKCLVSMSGAKEVKATFEANPKLTVAKAGSGASLSSVTSSPGGIGCGASCAAFYGKGTLVTLTPFPGIHTEAVQWTGCDEVLAGQCKVTMNGAKSVTATFNLEPGFALYPVTVEKTGTGQGAVTGSPGTISCGATCSGEYLTGATLTLAATPAPGSVFAHWSGGGCAGAGPCTTTVNKAKTVKAVFTLSGQRTLTVSKAGTGTGTVSGKAAGIACGATCSSQVPAGKKVTLSAKAAAGSAFAHWSGACSGAGTCKVTMTEARGVTATFSGGSSAASPPPSCVVPKLAGKSPRKARSALRAAHCALGKVSKPKARKGHKLGPLVVKSFSPGVGATLPAGGKVSLTLKLAKKHRVRHTG